MGVVVGPCPFLCLLLCLVCFLAKRKSGWGICGSSVVVLLFCVFMWIAALYMTTVSCTYIIFEHASLSVRTEPSSDIGQAREKKSLISRTPSFGSPSERSQTSIRAVCTEWNDAWKRTTERTLSEATRWLSWYGVGLASADRLPVVVRIPAGPLGSLKCDPPKGNGRRPKIKKKLSGL